MNLQKQHQNNSKRIIELGKDDGFKSQFINNYLKTGESQYMAETQFVSAFQTIIMNNSSNDIVQEPALYCAQVESIKRVLLTISSSGLLIDPKKKEVALFTSRSVSGEPFLDFILCYRGMYKLVGLSERVLSSCVEIVYEGDTFEWSGENQMPKYMMNLNHDKNKIVAGYCAFQMANGVVLAHMMSGDEIEELVTHSIEATRSVGGNSDMWTSAWKGRCIKSKIFRSAFNFYRASLLDNKAMIKSMTDEEPKQNIDNFAQFLETQLNKIEDE